MKKCLFARLLENGLVHGFHSNFDKNVHIWVRNNSLNIGGGVATHVYLKATLKSKNAFLARLLENGLVHGFHSNFDKNVHIWVRNNSLNIGGGVATHVNLKATLKSKNAFLVRLLENGLVHGFHSNFDKNVHIWVRNNSLNIGGGVATHVDFKATLK